MSPICFSSFVFGADAPSTRPDTSTPINAVKAFGDAVAARDREKIISLLADPDDTIRQNRITMLLDSDKNAVLFVPVDEVSRDDVAVVFNRQIMKNRYVFLMIPMVKIGAEWRLLFSLSNKGSVPPAQLQRVKELMDGKAKAKLDSLQEVAK